MKLSPLLAAVLISGLTATAAAPYAEWNFPAVKLNASKATRLVFGNREVTAVNLAPDRFCEVVLPLKKLPYRPDMRLVFEYRIEAVNEIKFDYLGVNFNLADGRSTFASAPAASEWTKAAFELGRLKAIAKTERTPLKEEDILTSIRIYTRIPSGEPPAMVKLSLRNLKIEADPDYDPLDGVRISYSAIPLFQWAHSPNRGPYRLAYGTDRNLTAPEVVTVECHRNFFAPAEPLRPGMIHYRVTDLGSGKVLLKDKLYIPERNHTFKPAPWNFAAVTAQSPPRLWNLARLIAEREGSPVPAAEKLLGFKVPPNPEPYREGADPEIRSAIEWYGRIAGGVIGATGNKMSLIGRAAMLSNKAELSAKAREVALEVARHWNPESGSHVKYHDLAAANLLLGLGYCYDAAYQIMTPEERVEVRQAIVTRGRQFQQRVNPFTGREAQNHPWDNTQAMAFAAVAVADAPESAEWFDYAVEMFSKRFIPSMGFDGESNEGIEYWSFGTPLLTRFADLARTTAGVDLYQHPWLRKTARFPLYSVPPEGFLAAFGDNGKPNHSERGPVNGPFVRQLAEASGDPQTLWYSGRAEVGTLKALPPLLDFPQSIYYPHIGVALFNTFLPDARENVAVGFHSGKFFATHQHPDQNSFVINAYGDKLAIDGGYYDWYGSPHFNAYSFQTKAHNTILVNGKGQAAKVIGADGKITAFFDSPGFGLAAGDASAPKIYNRELDRFERILLFIKPGWVVVADSLAAAEAATFRTLLHAHTDTMPPISPDGKKAVIERPLARLEATLLLPADSRWQGEKAYDVAPVNGYSVDKVANPQPEWTIFAENPSPARQLEFLSVMRIDRSGAPPPGQMTKLAGDHSFGFRSEAQGETIEVLFNRRPGETTAGDRIRTDAALSVLRFNHKGKLIDALIHQGTFLDCDGRPVFTRGPIRTAAQIEKTMIEEIPVNLTLDGRKIDGFYGYQVHAVDGTTTELISGALTLERTGGLIISNPGKQPIHGVISTERLRVASELAPETAGTEILLKPERYLLTLTAAGPIGPVALKTVPGEVKIATLRPELATFPATAIAVEAEDFKLENDPRSAVFRRPLASGGRAVTQAAQPGKYHRWEFELPQTGRYRLWLRYAAADDGNLRIVNAGANPGQMFEFNSTGGFGTAPGEWRYADAGIYELAAGKVTVTVKVGSGTVNLDRLVLTPETAD